MLQIPWLQPSRSSDGSRFIWIWCLFAPGLVDLKHFFRFLHWKLRQFCLFGFVDSGKTGDFGCSLISIISITPWSLQNINIAENFVKLARGGFSDV